MRFFGRKRIGFTAAAAAAAAFALCASPISASPSGTPQASVTLTNADAKFCYSHANSWELTKEVAESTVENGVGTVTWTVTATKDAGAANTFTVHGGLTVTNTGSAPATIGNIVINLQRPNSIKINGKNCPWISLAADIADATNGDASTAANIVAAASAESTPLTTPTFNALLGPANYVVAGSKGTFIETAASGLMEFKDASDNTIFSLVPQPVIPVGASVTLLYDAKFDAATVAAYAGKSLRVEALVSFGNAGLRGGSGSTASNIDVNGNGSIDPDEANVRTVASRITMDPIPSAPEECNDEVTVADSADGLLDDGTLTHSNPAGFDQFPATVSETTSWDVGVDVDGGEGGGSITNSASLAGTDETGTLGVVIGYVTQIDPVTLLPVQVPIYATYVCCEAADDDAASTVFVDAVPPDHPTTYSQGGYSGPGAPGQFFNANYLATFPLGLTIGVNDGAGARHHATWTGNAAGQTALKTFLGGGGPSGALTADTSNATSVSGGALAKQTATLTLNVGFAGTNFSNLELANLAAGSIVGSWTLTAAQATALNGTSISTVLADADNALGGSGLPAYVGGFGDLNQLVTALNESYDNGVPSAFAIAYLE